MKIISSYKIKIKHYNNIFQDTVSIYQEALSFFTDVCDKEWDTIKEVKGKYRKTYVESITHKTDIHSEIKYDFDKDFYKFPAYLRRAAIQAALGAVSSYNTSLANWDGTGKPPRLTVDHNEMPVFYKSQGGSYIRLDRNHAQLKIYHRNDWVWLDIELKEQDVKYIERHCLALNEMSPKLKRKGKQWYLTFPYVKYQKLTDVKDGAICAVDLGINNNATCSIMYPDGTVVARLFINLATEKDHLYKALGRLKKVQSLGARKTPVKWKHVNDLNTDISRKTAKAIMEFAILHSAQVIVFEYLDTSGKKRGANKQRLHLWRKREIQRIVEHNAHRNGMRYSRVCAWGTSRLAFDGSGRVTRGKYIKNGKEVNNYSMCIFPSGKEYNCDLNASYNIGARYHIRELLKSEPAMARLPDETKVSRYGTGTTRTLSTLIRLYADVLDSSKAV